MCVVDRVECEAHRLEPVEPPLPPEGETAAHFNAARTPEARMRMTASKEHYTRRGAEAQRGHQHPEGRGVTAETADGAQRPMLNVFHRDGGAIRHFWGSELFYAPTEPGQDPRHVGTIEPVWNLFDLTPEGRDEHFDEQLTY